jgi:adenosylmethionine-8-amino-7-oxononanoate aminotransferase
MIMEPILGAGGVIVPHSSFMPMVREICTRNGILLIADEVVTAFGRTGSWSGSRHWGVQPDLMSTAKAITNGYFPFGATMIAEHVAEVFEKDKGAMGMIGTGYTYSGHPVGAAAAIACLKETQRLNVTENAAARGAELFAGLQKLKDKHAIVGDVRGGHGLMCGIELVADRTTKAPLDKERIGKVHEVAYDNGVMIRVSGPNVIMSPALVLTAADVQTILGALDKGLAAA